MIKNNTRLAQTIRYFDIQNVDGYWYAFYYEDIMKSDEVRELNGIAKDN